MDCADASDPAFVKKIESLGLVEFFSGAEGAGKVTDLSIIAFEAGFALLSENLVLNLLCGPLFFGVSNPETFPFLNSSVITEIKAGKTLLTIAPSSSSSDLQFDAHRSLTTGALRLCAGAAAASFCFALDCKHDLWLLDLRAKVKSELEDSLDKTQKRYKLSFNEAPAFKLDSKAAKWLNSAFSILTACELAGVSAKAVAMTTEYVKTRKQFGQAIGSFQAVQQKLSEIYLKSEAMRSLALFAAWSADNSAEQASLASQAALDFAVRWSSWIVENAVQLHGGIGFTWEHDLHLYLRRARTLEVLNAPSDGSADRLIQAVE